MNAKKAIVETAKQNGVTLKEVREEIQKAINEGMKSSDPQVTEMWNRIPKKGEVPTPEEFIDFISKKVREQL